MAKSTLAKRRIQFETLYMPRKRTPYVRYFFLLMAISFVLLVLTSHFLHFDLKYLPYVYQ